MGWLERPRSGVPSQNKPSGHYRPWLGHSSRPLLGQTLRDINSDGKTDIFVQRTSGGEPYNGVVEKLILQQSSSGGSFQAVVPTYPEANTGSGWPLSGIEIALRDFNVDGFTDLVLKGVGAAVGSGGTPSQIIYASGEVFEPEPLGLRPVDGSLTQFVGNTLDYFVNPHYYVENAPYTYYDSVQVWVSWCGDGFVDIDTIFHYYFFNCFFEIEIVSGAYQNFSVFSEEAVSIWHNESSVVWRFFGLFSE